MKQTLIKVLVAAAALAVLAVVVYRAQRDAPAPQSPPAASPLAHDPVLPTPAKTDVVPGLQPLVRGPGDGVQPADEPEAVEDGDAVEAAEPSAASPEPAVELEPPELMFLPSTKAPAFAPVDLPDEQELDEE